MIEKGGETRQSQLFTWYMSQLEEQRKEEEEKIDQLELDFS